MVRFPTSDIARCYRIIASTLLGQKTLDEGDHEKFWSRLITMISKNPRPRTPKPAEADEVQKKNGELRGMLRNILDEQRKTRALLEKLIGQLGAGPGEKPEPRA